MAPTLRALGDEFLCLAGDVLVPPARRPAALLPSRLRAAALLAASAALALGAAVVLVGTACQLIERLLGPVRLDLAFPYLRAALRLYSTDHRGAIAFGLASAGLVAWLLLLRGLSGGLRRRWLMLTLLLGLLVVATAVDVAFTEGNGAVMEALNQRSAPQFWGTAIGLTAIYLVTLPLQFFNTYGQQRFALLWRDLTTGTLTKNYLQGQAYYRMAAAGSIDNPDQRIAEDIELAVVSSTNLFFGFCASLLSLAAYVLVLFSISGVLVITLLIATLAGNALILRLVRRLASLSFRQQALEADFRFALMHLRSHAESVAFLRGEAKERIGLERRFDRVLVNLERVIRWRAFVGQGTGLYGFLMQFVPYLVLSGAYFGGRVTLGELTVGSIAFGQVQAALSFLVDRADEFSGLFASLLRIGELRTATAAEPDSGGEPAALPALPVPALPVLPASAALPEPSSSALSGAGLGPGRGPGRGPELRLHQLSVANPGGEGLLVRNLDLRVASGDRLLITGPSGCGKTSLLRVICGLVPPAAGQLVTPAAAEWMVLPQQPYLALGSLREQLLYTAPPLAVTLQSEPIGDGELRRALVQARLQNLIERYPDLDAEADWEQVLSGGEQQRLGFARLLLSHPRFVILDEATSAIDLAGERHLYGLLQQAQQGVVSVGHRPSLEDFHDRVLRLDGRGGWSLAAC